MESFEAGINSTFAKIFLNPQQLIVFGHTLCSARGTGLDLIRVQCNSQIRNRRIFCFSASVRSIAVYPA